MASAPGLTFVIGLFEVLPDFYTKIFAVQRILIFFLAVHFFSGNMLINELVKMPYLVRHYRLHQQRNPGSTVLQFLDLHYSNARHLQSDPAHRQLPLQQVVCTTTICTVPPEQDNFAFPEVLAQDRGALNATDAILLPSDFRTRLLRPPRCLFV